LGARRGDGRKAERGEGRREGGKGSEEGRESRRDKKKDVKRTVHPPTTTNRHTLPMSVIASRIRFNGFHMGA
jgi:hypothetical protein